jgi:hypothetical protein
LDRTQDCCDFGIDNQKRSNTRLDLIHKIKNFRFTIFY